MSTSDARRAGWRLLLALLAVLLASSSLSPAAHAQRSSFRSVSAREAARMITRENGRVTMVLLYAAYCPHCRTMFPDFVDLAERYRRSGISVLAFATDDDAAATDEFVGSQRLPFARLHIEPWKEGELTKAFEATGIEIGAHFSIPLLAILDEDGEVAGQWGGASGVARAERWLEDHVRS